MRKTTLIVSLVFLTATTWAQKLDIKKIEVAGEKIIVHYDLDDSNPNTEYEVGLYASVNNYSAPLMKVSGDVGNEVSHGLNKKITWNVKEELGPYKGKLALELRGRGYAPFVKLTNFDVNKKYKRGKTYPLNWKVGSTNPIHIELYKGSERVIGELNVPNNGTFSLSLPSKSKTGSDYRLKITDSRNSNDVVYSGYFKVTPKVPLLLKILPVAILGGVGAAVATAGGGGGEDDGGGIPLPGFPGND